MVSAVCLSHISLNVQNTSFYSREMQIYFYVFRREYEAIMHLYYVMNIGGHAGVTLLVLETFVWLYAETVAL
jgi:hypothetical protein